MLRGGAQANRDQPAALTGHRAGAVELALTWTLRGVAAVTPFALLAHAVAADWVADTLQSRLAEPIAARVVGAVALLVEVARPVAAHRRRAAEGRHRELVVAAAGDPARRTPSSLPPPAG